MRKENNFRDLGGIPAGDGRVVRKGLFYRSGAPGDMNEEELAELSALGIRHIIDYRSSYEAQQLPDPAVEGAEYHHFNAMATPDGKEVDLSPKGLGKSAFSKENGAKFMSHFYGTLPFSPAYRQTFDLIRKGEMPILFHCTAGKDRTGIGAILILLALGCSEEDAIEDYLLTNEYRKNMVAKLLDRYREWIEKDPDLAEALQAVAGVNRESAEYSLKRIRDAYGTYENYFREVTGLDKDDLAEMRRKYTVAENGTESVSE